MADSAVSFVLGRLSEFAVKEAALLQEVGSDVMLLKDKLEWLQTFIQDADQKRRQGGNCYMDVWVQQTREVALEVEDVLDEFMLRVDLKQGLPVWRKWLRFLLACATQVSVRHGLSGRITMIRARLDQISDHKNAYITDYAPSAIRSSRWTYTPSAEWWDEEAEMVGFVKEREYLALSLAGGNRQRSIIWIVGDSGIGKSTLARQVYDSNVIMEQFDIRVWIKAPRIMRDTDVLHLISKKLSLDDKKIMSSGIHAALFNHLAGKRYLVVLDGLASLINWNSVLQALPDDSNGSRVTVTTRLKPEEALVANAETHSLTLQNMGEQETVALFSRNAFGSKSSSVSQEQDESLSQSRRGRDIFDLTGGLPLAILLLGRLLRRKEFPKQWDGVLQQLQSIQKSRHVEGILALCFDDLPNYLKSCFLYFAMMPENLILKEKRLVRLWTAEGFLKPRNGDTMEDVGQSYLKELISRGMVQLVTKHARGNLLVAIHGRLHSMAQFEAQESRFLEVYDNTDLPSPATIRHLFLQHHMHPYINMDTVFPKLRSILCDHAEEGTSNYSDPYGLSYNVVHSLLRSKFLRVIDLRGMQIREVPREIGSLIHLRYLGIKSNLLTKLPSSIGDLTNLQTLHVKRTKVTNMAQSFWSIPSLRHVSASKLRLPKSVGVLNNMQTITGLVCSHPWNNRSSPLHRMINLRYLEISELNSHHWEALADAFQKLESLLYLHLGVAANEKIPFSILSRFTLQLQILELYGAIDTSNKDGTGGERYTLPNLTRLVLKFSMVDQQFINKISELPSLRELVLSDKSYGGNELVFPDGGFASVTSLVMENQADMLEWKIRPTSIPRIERIAVSSCLKMKIKLDVENRGHEGSEGVMKHLNAVFFNMTGMVTIEPSDSPFSDKINRVAIRTKSVNITDAMLEVGELVRVKEPEPEVEDQDLPVPAAVWEAGAPSTPHNTNKVEDGRD